MRISSLPNDPAYNTAFHLCSIFLEGAQRNNVLLADEKGRFALTFARNEFGVPVLRKDGSQVTETFRGHVRVEAPEWLRTQMESPQDEDEGALGAAIFALITQTP
jgi:hypothetical protein